MRTKDRALVHVNECKPEKPSGLIKSWPSSDSCCISSVTFVVPYAKNLQW